jgi:PST family polysaccharide transporter
MSSSSIKKSVLINVLGKYSSVVINIIYIAILSRILSPGEFGIIAVIMVFTTFFTLLADIGIGPSIIQNKKLNIMDYNSIYSFTFYYGILLSLLFIIISFPMSYFYNESSYIRISLLLSVSIFFSCINIVPNSLIYKDKKFTLISIRIFIISISSAIPTIYLASIGFSYYSIVIHSILVSLITYLWNIKYSKLKFKLTFSIDSLRKIQEFSKYQFIFSIVNYFSRNLDNILIGKFLGNTNLGYYNKSYQLMKYPVSYLTYAITPVLHPILSEHENDKKYIYNKYIKILKVLSILGIYITIASYIMSREIIIIMFGNQWELSIPSFRFLSISIWAQMLLSSTGSIFQSINRTKLMMQSGILSTLVIIISIVVGLLLGDINSIALSVSLGYLIVFFIKFYLLINNGFNTNFVMFLRLFIIDMVNAFLLYFISLNIIRLISFENLFVSLVYKVFIITFVYIMLLIFTKQYKYIYKFQKK